jgi:hypothetical protein
MGGAGWEQGRGGLPNELYGGVERWTRPGGAREHTHTHNWQGLGPERTGIAGLGGGGQKLGNSSSAVDGQAAAVRMSNNCGCGWMWMWQE